MFGFHDTVLLHSSGGRDWGLTVAALPAGGATLPPANNVGVGPAAVPHGVQLGTAGGGGRWDWGSGAEETKSRKQKSMSTL